MWMPRMTTRRWMIAVAVVGIIVAGVIEVAGSGSCDGCISPSLGNMHLNRTRFVWGTMLARIIGTD